jgi:hypothetical protein
VWKYKYVCQFTVFGNTGDGCLPNLATHETNPAKPFTGPGGVAIDTHGNVYVSDFSGAVYEFNSAGEDVRQATIPTGEPSGLAVDSNGVVYLQDFQGPVYKLTLNVSMEFEVAELDTANSFAVAVDPATNDVYVDHREYIDVYEGGALDAELRPGGLSSEGIAVNSTTHDIYAANILSGSIEAFTLVRIPDVRLSGEATGVTTASATLHGEVDPEETSDASYYFEYGTGGTYTATTPSTSAGAGDAFAPATAELTGLLPRTTYNYRLVATNSSGLTNVSEEGTLTTSNAPPEVSEVEAIEITTDSVIFRGEVNPQSDPTRYRFEYGETEGYGQRLPEIAVATSATDVPIEQASPMDLKPRSTYHYRLVAVDSAGEAASTDHTFTTTSNGTPPEAPPLVSTLGVEALTPSSATLTAIVFPEDTPTTYLFELGTTSAYGTVLFGGEAGHENGSVKVAQAVASLQPGITYHYRVEAFNAAGIAVGADRSFTTPSLSPGIVQPATPQLLAIPLFPAVKIPAPKPKKHPKGKKRGKPRRKHAKGKKATARRTAGRRTRG